MRKITIVLLFNGSHTCFIVITFTDLILSLRIFEIKTAVAAMVDVPDQNFSVKTFVKRR